MTDRDAIAAYVDGCEPNARVHLGLLSNPLARTNWQSVGHRQLREELPDPSCALETGSLSDLDPAFERLLFAQRVNVLVLNGGDGTIHHALNAAVRVTRRAAETVGRHVPLPLFLFVNGGGMNMLARVFGSRGHPVRTLRRFLGKLRGARFGTLPKRAVPLLAAREPDGFERLGYIFGSELVFNALTMYERFGQGYPALVRFLWEVAAGYTLHTELWNQFGHLLEAPQTPLVIDDAHYAHYTSVVATTVPLQLVKGLVGTIRGTAYPTMMNAVAVLPTDKGEVIRLIPHLMRGATADGIEYARNVRRMVLHGAYTLDGERFDRHERDRAAPLEIVGTQHIVWGVVP